MQTPVTIEPAVLSLNESPSEKEGKFPWFSSMVLFYCPQ